MAFTRTTTINSAPGGDSVKQAVLDLDTDLTGAFANANTTQNDLNVHKGLTTNPHSVTYAQTGAAPLAGSSSQDFAAKNLTTSGNTTLGDATTDTLTVGVNGIVKTATSNVLIGTTTDDGVNKLQVNGSISISDMTGSASSFYQSGPANLVLADTNGNSATMGASNLFRYVRVGKLVFVSGTLNWTSTTALTSRIVIKGLPFIVKNMANYRVAASIGSSASGAFNIPRGEIAFVANWGNYFVWGTHITGNNVDTDLFPASIGTSGILYGFTITYETD